MSQYKNFVEKFSSLKLEQVAKEYRRRGIARKLMSSVMEKTIGSNIYLSTSFAQLGAVNFYKSLGFESIEVKMEYSIEWPKIVKNLLGFSLIQCYKQRNIQ